MSCDCETILCVKAHYNPCSAGVELDIIAESTGSLSGEIEFNGMWSAFTVGTVEGEKIIFPTELLNEFYNHELHLGDDCYSLQARAYVNAGTFDLLLPDNILSGVEYTGNETNTMIVPELDGKELVQIGMGGQEYQSDQFTQTGTSVVLTAGAFVGTVVFTYKNAT